MNLSQPFIMRPVATTLLMAALLLGGALACGHMALSALPEVDYPTIQVRTSYPGASPEIMAAMVTGPLETQFGQMPSLQQMTSTSAFGCSQITLAFALDLRIDVAEQEVQAAINAAGSLLPYDLPAPPIYAKVNPADAPVLTLGVTSDLLPMTRVEDLTDSLLAMKLSQLSGVGLVSLSGGQRPAVRIEADPAALAAHSLSIDDLRTCIASANVNTPKGGFNGPTRIYTINANDQLRSAAEYKPIILAYRNGAAVRIADVARIVDAPQDTTLSATIGSPGSGPAPAIIVNIQRQPNANVITLVDAIQRLLPQLESRLPSSVHVQVIADRTTTIRASIRDVECEMALAIVLVILVILVFLGSVTATLIPSLSVPLSLVGTAAVMYLAGFSINNLTLMALTIATGFVVDDAIVMIENISRYTEQGLDAKEAALRGAGQIGFTVISLTISLIAVLIPLLLMGDVVGRLFREFAITLAVTILLSAVVSLTLVPMLSARLLHAHPSPGPTPQRPTAWVARLIAAYGRSLSWCIRHSGLTMSIAGLTCAAAIILYLRIPKSFFPVQDTGLIQGVTVVDPTASSASLAVRQDRLIRQVLADPDVEHLSSFLGVDGANTASNGGRLLISLRPRSLRASGASDIIRRLQDHAASIPGITMYLQPVQDLTIDDVVSPTQYQLVLESASRDELGAWTQRLLERLRTLPELADVAGDFDQQGLSVNVAIDHDAASSMGISTATVANALDDAYGQRIVSTVFTESNQYRIILGADVDRTSVSDALGSLYLPTSGGTPTPLRAIADISLGREPLQIKHLGQFPAATLSFNLARGATLGQAMTAISRAQRDIGVPASISVAYQGAARAFEASSTNELLLVLAAIVTMYIVLGILYESFIHPITILSTLPSAGTGALLALWWSGGGLGVIGIIGIILLIGIVKKNAIMMIDFALDAERSLGLPPREAIYQACLLRFRPILMTTMSAIVGAVPLMLGTGVGSELRRPLGIAIVGGLIVSQLLTLYTTPVIYLCFSLVARWLQRGRTAPTHPSPPPDDALTPTAARSG